MDRLVLLIDDDDDHAELVRRAMERLACGHELVRFANGEQAVAFVADAASGLGQDKRQPDLVLLDLRLPRLSGLEVLRHMRASRELEHTPVVVFSTSDAATDVAEAYELGANAYVVKPGTFSRFRELVQVLTQFWLSWNLASNGPPELAR